MAIPEEYDLTGINGAATFRELPLGLHLKLADGAIGEIVGNPHDGSFVIVKVVDCEDSPSRVGTEEAIFFTEVEGVVSSPAGR